MPPPELRGRHDVAGRFEKLARLRLTLRNILQEALIDRAEDHDLPPLFVHPVMVDHYWGSAKRRRLAGVAGGCSIG